jgi:hypothetical protein
VIAATKLFNFLLIPFGRGQGLSQIVYLGLENCDNFFPVFVELIAHCLEGLGLLVMPSSLLRASLSRLE